MPTGSGTGTPAIPIASSTVTRANLRTRIRAEIGDDVEAGVTNDYTDSQLDLYISRAVEKYSDLSPFVLKYSLTSVADQYLYVLPFDAAMIQRVKWRNTPFTVPTNVAPTMRMDWKDNGMIDARDQIVANFDRMTQTSWAQVNNPQSYLGGVYLMLFPTPLYSGDEIEVWYTALHPLTDSTETYPTIPNEHLELVVKLAVAVIMRREARIMVRQPDIAAGQGLRVGSKPGAVLLQEAQYLEQQVSDLLTRPVALH